eukprot:TRINITY_DN29413_c0_g1_i1.p1 TRINITY_DN29413_c0_g1~~TRINITY_DN29413_c0_g1_i1.p1  ORF type:complete len:549 (+),score=108.90 TRINITY_DN29413_c0_g1_i1:120-1766(+)
MSLLNRAGAVAAAHRHHAPAVHPPLDRNVFEEATALRAPGRNAELREADEYNDGICGKIVRSRTFEIVTNGVICINALEIGLDVEFAARSEKPRHIAFTVIECFFTAFFTIELIIRFLAYKVKWHCIQDGWFLYDSVLVVMMVIETWVLAAVSTKKSAAEFIVLRLMRLLRVTRIARLMRMLPELMLLVKGMVESVRAVIWTVMLLVMTAFTCSILFTSEYHQGLASDDDVTDQVEGSFGSMGKSMFTLIVMGTILDDVTYASDLIRSTNRPLMTGVFLIFIVISSFTMMNMLLGILVEVVETSAQSEKRKLRENDFRKAVRSIVSTMDTNLDSKVSRKEFLSMQDNPLVFEALQEIDVAVDDFGVLAELMYGEAESNDPEGLSYDQIATMILRLGPGSSISALDLHLMSRFITESRATLKKRLSKFESIVGYAINQRLPSIQDSNGSCYGGVAGACDEKCVNDAINAPECNRPRTIGVDTLANLDAVPPIEIIEEIQRRLGVKDWGQTGVPLAMLDDELQSRVREVEELTESFETLGVPQNIATTEE